MVLGIETEFSLEERLILPCEDCGCPTPHVLSTSHIMYVCGCGSFIEIERKGEEDEKPR